MAELELRIDSSQFARLANYIGAAGAEAPKAIARAVNRAGDMTRTAMVRALTMQTGLERRVIVKALKTRRVAMFTSVAGAKTGASTAEMAYTISSRGGNVGLKYFGARETARGVSAAPWGHRQVFAGTFTKGGRFPRRVTLSLGGQVFKRTGKGRAIEKQASGLYIPEEMIVGASEQAFRTVSGEVIQRRLLHELARVLGG